MNQQQMYEFVEQYLRAQECEIIEQDRSYLRTQLTIDADKDITNRPYYWMFVERTGAEPQPQQLTFIFDEEQAPEEVQGELIKFGCWRLHQIFQSAKKKGQFVRLYEQTHHAHQTQGLIPWLWLNYKISYISDQKKDIYYPLGFNLMTGHIIPGFDQLLRNYELTPKIPDYHFTLRPIFSLRSAIGRIEQHFQYFLEKEDQSWAEEANLRLDEEREMILSFFVCKQEEHDQMTLQTRLAEVEQYRPRIEINPINVGFVYLQTNPLSMVR